MHIEPKPLKTHGYREYRDKEGSTQNPYRGNLTPLILFYISIFYIFVYYWQFSKEKERIENEPYSLTILKLVQFM